MDTILDAIVAHKQREVALQKEKCPLDTLEKSPFFEQSCFSLAKSLQAVDNSGIIAEFKRKSPSKGDINTSAQVEIVTQGYAQHGAAALSVLTDQQFFNGSATDLKVARKFNDIPILRKDFVIDEYQIIEAKAAGADVILLIAECLTAPQIKSFTQLAQSLGLEVLLELHSAEQLHKVSELNNIIGINNRDLKTFTVDIERSIALAHQLPDEAIKVAESGLNDPQTVFQLKQAGFDGFLMGEHFMKTADPVETFHQFSTSLQQLTKNSLV